MCLAVPACVTALLPDERAAVSLGGVSSTCSLELVAGVAVGDYVIVHVGYALSKLDPAEAERTLALLAEIGAPATAPPTTAEAPDHAAP